MCALEIKEVERLLAQHYISRTLSQLQFMQFKVQSSTQIHDVNSNENDDDDESRIWRVERERIFMNEKKNRSRRFRWRASINEEKNNLLLCDSPAIIVLVGL